MPQLITTDCDDLPALVCIYCNKVSTIGGPLWEDEHPSTEMCDCEEAEPLWSLEACRRLLRAYRW